MLQLTPSLTGGIVVQSALGGLVDTLLGSVIGLVPTVLLAALILGVGFGLGQWLDDIVYRWSWRHRFDDRAAETPADRIVDDEEDAVSAALGGFVRTFVYVLAVVVAVSVLDIQQLDRLSGVVVGYVPNVVAAAVLLAIGLSVGIAARRIVGPLVERTDVGASFPSTHLGRLIGAEHGSLGSLAGITAEYYVYLVTTYFVASMLSLRPVAGLLAEAVFFVPIVVGAAAVVVLGSIVATYANEVAVGTEPIASSPFSQIAAGASEAVVYVFTAVIALNVLGVDSLLLGVLLLTVVFPLGLAVALAFGFGGQDHVEEWLRGQRTDSPESSNVSSDD
ncbi:mechanosensitive ion channel family protein [Halobaculum rubrum]|uniref:mechanosensitive ion channel family protein n=1 Tax=Halobaculum rubrum TaxID=2872158 RepID=UPI001CA3F597|nr:hypothetical protein [Halobaculum rubrum]QZX99521.1 hypothetical protein K6T25_15005 [Halobaculum rubrum]